MKKIIFSGIILLMIFLGGCSQTDTSENNRLQVVASIFPYYEFAKNITGDKADVFLILPPGAEVHTFDPSPRDIIKVSEADLFIYTGESLEPWAEDIITGFDKTNMIVIEASSVADLIILEDEHETEDAHEEEHEHGSYDPHIWLDFSNDMEIIDAITKHISNMDPENRGYYLQNAETYKKKLEMLDNEYMVLSGCERQEFISGGHNSFRYITRRYNLSVISAYGLSPDSEPTPKTIKEISDIVQEKDIRYILSEEILNKRVSEAIAQETGAQLLIFNPAGNLLKEQYDSGESFITIMGDNLASLKIALGCEE